jgi:hypothetical protein
VLALRSQYGEPKRVLTDPLLYYDPQYYEAAKRRPLGERGPRIERQLPNNGLVT